MGRSQKPVEDQPVNATRHDDVGVEWDGDVAIIMLDRPLSNHVDLDTLRNLANAFDDLDADPHCRAVVLYQQSKILTRGIPKGAGL